MKAVIVGLLAFLSFIPKAHSVQVDQLATPVSDKVSVIYGNIGDDTMFQYTLSVANTMHIPGDRIIFINSPGGWVDPAQRIIDVMKAEQASGTRLICVVKDYAGSMAFNILSHCDKRIAVKGAKLMFHHLFTVMVGEPTLTAAQHRMHAKRLDAAEEPYTIKNMEALRMSRREYDHYADRSVRWSDKVLLKRGYLDAIIEELAE